jgi:AcrR family transcriptional regulator
MARPRLVSDAALLDCARKEFLEYGTRASTNTIASKMGVSEAVLFKRFGSKEGLLRASMQDTLTQDFTEPFPSVVTEQGLVRLAEALFRHFEAVVPMVLMSWAHLNGSHKPEALCGSEPKPMKGVRLFEAYFRQQVKAGNLRKVNATVLAHALTGPVWQLAFMRTALDPIASPKTSPKLFVRDLVHVLWFGIAPVTSSEHL